MCATLGYFEDTKPRSVIATVQRKGGVGKTTISVCLTEELALARRLAVIVHRIWVDGTEFRWTREQAAAAPCELLTQ